MTDTPIFAEAMNDAFDKAMNEDDEFLLGVLEDLNTRIGGTEG